MKLQTILAGLLSLVFGACDNSETKINPKPAPSEPNLIVQQEISEDFNTEVADIYCNDKRVGFGTIVRNSRGKYVITARHLFKEKAAYIAVGLGKQKEILNIVALKGDDRSDLIVGIFGKKPVEIRPLESKLTQAIQDFIRKGGKVDVTITKDERLSLPYGKNVLSLVGWDMFKGQKVECLDCFLGNGSSGGGFISSNDERTFWVVFGEWPYTLNAPLLFELSRRTPQDNAKGFTLVTGASWTQIEGFYGELMAEKK